MLKFTEMMLKHITPLEKDIKVLEGYYSTVSSNQIPWVHRNYGYHHEIKNMLYAGTKYYLHIPSFKEPKFNEAETDNSIKPVEPIQDYSKIGRYIFSFTPTMSWGLFKRVNAVFNLGGERVFIKFRVLPSKGKLITGTIGLLLTIIMLLFAIISILLGLMAIK